MIVPVLGEKEARDRGWKVGDQIPMGFARAGVRQVRVGGTFRRSDLGAYLVSRELYDANYTTRLDAIVLAKVSRDTPLAAARRSLGRVVAAYPNVKLYDRADFKREQARRVDIALGMIYVLLGLTLFIALLGIVNTLALSVLERTREIGLVRAVGMSRRQLRRMVRWESVIIAVLGDVLGLVVGLLFGWALVRALHDQGIGRLVVPVAALAAFPVVAGLAGVAAAVFPARRAAGLDVLAALAQE